MIPESSRSLTSSSISCWSWFFEECGVSGLCTRGMRRCLFAGEETTGSDSSESLRTTEERSALRFSLRRGLTISCSSPSPSEDSILMASVVELEGRVGELIVFLSPMDLVSVESTLAVYRARFEEPVTTISSSEESSCCLSSRFHFDINQ